jgi:hypothetical protein
MDMNIQAATKVGGRANNPTTPSPAAVSRTTQPAATSVWDDCAAAGDIEEVAAHFPAPSAEIADRLVGLLLPRRLNHPKGESVA